MKRSQLVFQVLIGLVLSAIVLFMIYSFFIKGFFNNYNNYDLAKLEGEDISNFLKITGNSKYNNCYYLFDIVNSPNIQFTDSNKYLYFLYITQKGVYVFKAPLKAYNDNFVEKTLKDFSEGKEVAVKRFKVPDNLKICEDDTSSGSIIVNSITMFFGHPDREISLSNINGGIVVMPIPSETGDDTYYRVTLFKDGKLDYGTWKSIKDNIVAISGNSPEVSFLLDGSVGYLIYSKYNDCVFVPNSYYTKLLAMARLCRFKEIAEVIKKKQLELAKSKFLSGNAGDEIFYSKFVVECDKSSEKFIWDIREPNLWVCEGCGDLKSSCHKGVKECYKDFVSYVKKYFSDEFADTDIGFKVYVKSAEPIAFSKDESSKLDRRDYLKTLNASTIEKISAMKRFFNENCEMVENKVIKKGNLFKVFLDGVSLEGIIYNGVLYFCNLNFVNNDACGDMEVGYEYIVKSESVSPKNCLGFDIRLLKRDEGDLFLVGKDLEVKTIKNSVGDNELVLFKFDNTWFGITKEMFKELPKK